MTTAGRYGAARIIAIDLDTQCRAGHTAAPSTPTAAGGGWKHAYDTFGRAAETKAIKVSIPAGSIAGQPRQVASNPAAQLTAS